jgi:hypothetical protein
MNRGLLWIGTAVVTMTVAAAGARAAEPQAVATVAGAKMAAAATDTAGGVLELYTSPNPLGLAGRREFRDDKGRVAKTIFYMSNRVSPPYPEDSLAVHSIVIITYSEDGRRSREEHRNADMTLARIQDIETTDESTSTHSWRRPDETLSYQIVSWRGPEGKLQQAHLYFDVTGKRLVAAGGVLPAGVDLAEGWGETVNGLACGIGAERRCAPLDEMTVSISFRNSGKDAAKVVTALPYHELRMELHDAKGDLVPQDVEGMAKRDRQQVESNRGTGEARQTVEPGGVGNFSGPVDLKDWYKDLAPGPYRLTIRHRAAGDDFPLVSNTLTIEIKGTAKKP